MKTLLEMLTWKRPHFSDAEVEFVEKYIDTIPGIIADDYGNRILVIGNHPTTLFSAHTDTVHSKGGRQDIVHDTTLDSIYKNDGEPLGADNAAGIYCLMHLIKHNVPGMYIFHRGEERGGLGSRHIADKTPELLKGIKRAIAFDRRDTKSIITFQRSARCCSNDFANALADELNLGHKCDTGGSFTDTASYMRLIPECTNVSVGYMSEHTKNEIQDLAYLRDLLQAIVKVEWEKLPTKRDHTAKPEYKAINNYSSNYYGTGRKPSYTPPTRITDAKARRSSTPTDLERATTILYEGSLTLSDYEDLMVLCKVYPDVAATLLEEFGCTNWDIKETNESIIKEALRT